MAKLIIGLGNPGKEYELTRHNLGFMVVQYLAKQLEVEVKKGFVANSIIAKSHYQQQVVWLLQPLTFMNNSGWF